MKKFVAGLAFGCLVTAAAPAVAQTVQQFLLVQPTYPVLMEGNVYDSKDMPALNYNGSTYVPLAALEDRGIADVRWDSDTRRVLVTAKESGTPPMKENEAFRVKAVTGQDGRYTVQGEARVFEGVMHYAVSDGHNYLLDSHKQLHTAAPEWAPFELELNLPADKLPGNGTLTLELYEESAKDGSRVFELIVPLQSFR